MFQSRAGFSECLDAKDLLETGEDYVFQSRAGFSECLDHGNIVNAGTLLTGFNPVLGFLSVSTIWWSAFATWCSRFQSRAGFSECLDP